ncbi:MAG: ATP-binding cassette domain-containing protein, partial [Saprospiraceae bacterium]
IGQFVAAEILVFYVIESVEKLILLHETGYDVLTATEKIGQVADLPLERSDGIRVEAFSSAGPLELELRDLSYQYEDGEVAVLKNLNLKIKAGERLAIAGYNRSGKSTLMQLLSLLRLNFTGSLLFNGLPKPSLHLRSLRQHIGDLSAQEDIFSATLRENITLGRAEIALQKLLQIMEEVGLSDFMRHESQGLETLLQPGGKNIPRSVVTKILVARAIVASPRLLALEEPLGNLNFRDRLRIARFLTDRSHPWTLVSVTEDPLLASMCDRVLVMQEGRIVFDGTFDELQKTRHYERIFRSNMENSTWNDEPLR